jgi:hypothetical protein
MGDGTKESPYTREDVLRLLKETEEPGEVLDLSGKVFEEEIDLHGLDLGIIDLSESYLNGANLEGARLWGALLIETRLIGANLKGTNLRDAHLWGAKLFGVELEGADLRYAELWGAYLRYTEFPHNAKLEEVDWGKKYFLGEEVEGSFEEAEATYRRLKIWHTEQGLYDLAGKFFYREMEVKRKTQSWKKEPHLKLWSWILRMLCGYGEKPERVVISAAVVIFGLAIAYFLWGSFSSSSFADTLYYSVASFTALGYGQWAPQPTEWAKGMGAAEAVLGVSMLALFLVTFTRKMIR